MLNCVDVNYKVASFKCSYNGNQKRRFVRATGHEAKGFTVRNIDKCFNPIENYCKSNGVHQVRFGTCLSFMKCFDHF